MKGRLLIAPGFDPYVNLALEALLTEAVQPGELLLYLWRNARTVVIGRNQNPYRECDRTLLEAEGVPFLPDGRADIKKHLWP